MAWNYDDEGWEDDVAEIEYTSQLVFAVDILSPCKLVTLDSDVSDRWGLMPFRPFNEERGVIVHEGEPVNTYTIGILKHAGIKLPLPPSAVRSAPVVHERRYL